MATSQESPSVPLRVARGSNFEDEECVRLCKAWLNTSQSAMKESGQKHDQFWARVAKVFEESCPQGSLHRPQRSLESKWGIINHDVSKFAGAYTTMCDLDESGTTKEDCIEKAKVIYQDSSKNNKPFIYMECWRVLRNAPKWRSYRNHGIRPPPQKHQISEDSSPAQSQRVELGLGDGEGELGNAGEGSATSPVRPIGNKKAKRQAVADAKVKKLESDFAKATAAMVDANLKKVEVLRDAANLQHFSIPLTGLGEDAVRYITLKRAQVLRSLEASEAAASMPTNSRSAVDTSVDTGVQDLPSSTTFEEEMDEFADHLGI